MEKFRDFLARRDPRRALGNARNSLGDARYSIDNKFDSFRNRGEPSPLQAAGGQFKGEIMDEFGNVMMSSKLSFLDEYNEWYERQLANYGLGSGHNLNRVGHRYFASLAEMALNNVISGNNMALVLSGAGEQVTKVIKAKGLEDKMNASLRLCHTIVKRRDKTWKQLTDVEMFAPWMGLLRSVDNKRNVIMQDVKQLNKAVGRNESNLHEAGKAIGGSARDLTEAAQSYDANLDLYTRLDSLRERSTGVAAEIVGTLAERNKPVSGLANEMSDIRKQLSVVPEDAIKASSARAKMLEETGKTATDLMGMTTLMEIDESTRITLAATKLVGTTMPLVGMYGVSNAIKTETWYAAWAVFAIADKMGQMSPEMNLDTELLRTIIENQWQASLGVMKNEPLQLSGGKR